MEPELKSEAIDGDLVRALKTKQFRGLSPTEGLSKLVLLHEIQQSQDRSVLFVRYTTNRKESDTSRQIRMFFWTLAVKDIPPTMIDHLYIGDMAGLLCALIPRHAGRPEELQAKAVKVFYAVTKKGRTFTDFRTNFLDACDTLVATGMILPKEFIRLQFVAAMNTDQRYVSKLIELLTEDPPVDLDGLILRLQLHTGSLQLLGKLGSQQGPGAYAAIDTTPSPSKNAIKKAKRKLKNAAKAAEALAVAKGKLAPRDQRLPPLNPYVSISWMASSARRLIAFFDMKLRLRKRLKL